MSVRSANPGGGGGGGGGVPAPLSVFSTAGGISNVSVPRDASSVRYVLSLNNITTQTHSLSLSRTRTVHSLSEIDIIPVVPSVLPMSRHTQEAVSAALLCLRTLEALAWNTLRTATNEGVLSRRPNEAGRKIVALFSFVVVASIDRIDHTPEKKQTNKTQEEKTLTHFKILIFSSAFFCLHSRNQKHLPACVCLPACLQRLPPTPPPPARQASVLHVWFVHTIPTECSSFLPSALRARSGDRNVRMAPEPDIYDVIEADNTAMERVAKSRAAASVANSTPTHSSNHSIIGRGILKRGKSSRRPGSDSVRAGFSDVKSVSR